MEDSLHSTSFWTFVGSLTFALWPFVKFYGCSMYALEECVFSNCGVQNSKYKYPVSQTVSCVVRIFFICINSLSFNCWDRCLKYSTSTSICQILFVILHRVYILRLCYSVQKSRTIILLVTFLFWIIFVVYMYIFLI